MKNLFAPLRLTMMMKRAPGCGRMLIESPADMPLIFV